MFHVAALYKFTRISSPESLKEIIFPKMKDLGITGTLICAPEGINGTIAGTKDALQEIIALLATHIGVGGDDVKWSTAALQPFKRCKFKLKPEIVTLRKDGVDSQHNTGEFVTPQDWNKILQDPDMIIIDTRNDYEVEIGTFKNAINPKTDCFTEFPEYIAENYSPEKNKKVAMFCTGGIRCEKASAYMRSQGYETVYQLHGGILKYLEDVPAEQSLWEGECFVFDDRVSVKHGLEEGDSEMCYGCGFPVMEKDQDNPLYEAGVCCPRCHDLMDDDRKQVLRERHERISQERLAKSPAITKNAVSADPS